MGSLSFQYPSYFLLFCAILGFAYAALLYWGDTTFREQSAKLNKILAFFRWLAVTILAALLLSPLLKSKIIETKKPIVVLAQDQSESVGAALSGANFEKFKTDWTAVKNALAENYEVHEMAFGDRAREGVDWQFSDKTSNVSELMQAVYDQFSSQNLGAVVVSTDGIYNEGSNPAYSSAQFAAPIYTIGLGDTTPRRDLVVKRAFHNKIAYLGDKFALQVDVAATNSTGAASVLTVSKITDDGEKTVGSTPISVAGNDFFTTKSFNLDADKPGVARYRISLAKISGEVSTVNNSKEIFVDILDARQKILLLANGPHPDLSALKSSIEINKNYSVAIAYASDPSVNVANFDFVVLHNLPSMTNDIAGILRVLNEKKTPRLFFGGLQTNFSALAKAQNLVSINGTDGKNTNEVQPTFAPNFATFTLDPRVVSELPKFNPALAPFGNFAASSTAQTLLFQRIGKIDTKFPLLAVGDENGIRTGVFMGEGVWKWRLFDFLQHNNHEIFDELFGKTVQYLSLKEDKRKFRVTLDKNIFEENEAVVFGAELYNDNYELVNESDVAMTVKNKEGKEFTYNFNKIGKGYTLNAGILPVGNYNFHATTTWNGQPQIFDGQFSVRPIELELFDLTANHAVLRQLSQKFGGDFVAQNNLASVADLIKNKESVKPVIYETTKTRSVINLKWIFALLAALLVLEWFLRRYFGAY
jgi:hypothetical protein